jgi:predicted Zn-dependent protease
MKGGEANAVAVPGARVFVSEGLISLCRDEAELAAVVAHEMTHVILKHGLKEMRARSVEIHADEAMGELEAMSADEPDADAEELEDWAQSAFEVVNKPRLLGYEEEADRGAALLLARAGYDPSALLDMIGRAGEAASSAKEGAPANPFTGTDYKGRSQAAGEFLKGLAACGKAREAGRFAAAVRAARLDR